MNTVIAVLISVLAVIFGIGSFILNCRKQKDYEEKLKKAENGKTAAEENLKNYTEAKKENEELIQRVTSGNSSDSANASLELLHNISTKGRKRNSNS